MLVRRSLRPSRRWSSILSLGAGWLYAGAAAAAPDGLDEPTAWRADPRPIPEHVAETLVDRSADPLPAGQAQTNVLYLNYDGVTIKYTGGPDNSATNTSQFPDFAMTYQPYGNGAKRAASMQALVSDWSKYDVVVTDTRPNSGSYTMCVNSPTNPFGGGVLGIAPLDCFDGQAPNIVFAYHSDNDQFSAATQATTMSQEIAHAYGLEHVKQENDIMNPYNAGGDPSFIDQCFALDGGNIGIQCGQQHQQFCQNGQNSHQEMVWLFGLREPDAAPPTISVTSPGDGMTYFAPAQLTIALDVNDNVAIKRVDLYIDGAKQASLMGGPYSWPNVPFPVGQHCLYAEAFDTSDNKATSNTVCVNIMEEMPSTTGPSTTTTTTTGDATGIPDTGTGGDSATGGGVDPTATGTDGGGGGIDSAGNPALPDGYGQFDEEGCGCAESPRGSAGLALLVVLAGARRRRRRG